MGLRKTMEDDILGCQHGSGEGVGRWCAEYREGGANKSLAFNHTTAYYLSVTSNRETSEN